MGKIQELIEKYEYYDQISICSFNHKFYEKVEKYNNEYNRKIVFGFLMFNVSNLENFSANNQITLEASFLRAYPRIVELAHKRGLTVGVWFVNFYNIIKEPTQYNYLFEIGVDVIITDYPIRVKNQLDQYYSGNIYIEGCKSTSIYTNNIINCNSCEEGYERVHIGEKYRYLCKLKYEIDPELHIREYFDRYREKKYFQ